MGLRGILRLSLVLLLLGSPVWADSAAFDLSGPRVQIRVTRAGKTLPVSQVPNLQPGDRLWIKPELPKGQSAHYLLISAFLRGATNPPPEAWFVKADTWSKQMQQEGIVVTVPQGAQQALLFLAPQTGGDFGTLRSTVSGKPGAFVRASQDLNQASLDRSRLERYLAAVRQTAESDPSALHERSVLLARSLNMKLDEQCFDKPSAQQAPCLVQNTDQLVLDDGHSQTLVSTLTSGPGSDLIGQVSNTRVAGGGAYSAYVGAIVDVVRLMEKFHTPSYQYIPALVLPKGEQLNLKLNNPPSFNKPKSVLVVSLPAVEAAQLPRMQPVDADKVSCLQKPALVLPVKGAPLIFSTDLAHDFVLQVQDKSGKSIDLPAKADPARGGFVIDSNGISAANLDGELSGTLRGHWGFEAFEGATFPLRNANSSQWKVPDTEVNSLTVGQENTIHLQSDAVPCVDKIALKDEAGKVINARWKPTKADELELRVALHDATPGQVTVLLKPYGTGASAEVSLKTYSQAAQVEQFAINAGDREGVLHGMRLSEVAAVDLKGLRFLPAGLARVEHKDQLRLKVSADPAEPDLKPEENVLARVALKDGRVLDLQTTVGGQRPRVTIVSKTVQPGQSSAASFVRLANPDDLPQDGRLSFLLKSELPARFPKNGRIEVATADESFRATLTLTDGSLILQDPQTVLAVLDPLKSLGPSAFGELRIRPVNGKAKGDWQPLARVVRVPALKEVRCPDNSADQCSLIGSSLFLIESVASDPQFTNSTQVPLGFSDTAFKVPRPSGTLLYVKLRDNPSAVNAVYLPVLPERR